LKITDNNGGETGVLHGWGVQFNNNPERKINLNITAFMQGFYNASSNLMTPDTMRIYIRENTSPFNIIDSARTLLSSSGLGLFSVDEDIYGRQIYIQLRHRNSIETWTNSPGFIVRTFDQSYSFADNSNRAFGNNQIQIDESPFRFAIYSGDVNQDGTVDATDVSLIDNDAANFTSGYVITDITGDDFVDGSDFAIANNNAADFVSVIRP
jgi:hypothetical protein